LQQGSGIHSQTLHSLLRELDEGHRTLVKTDVVVLDEAGMVGTRQMARLLGHVHRAQAKAVWVGDSMQLQPIDAGGMFRKLSQTLGRATLTDIRRQDKAQDRQMIHDLIAGHSEAVIDQLQDHGQLRVVDNAFILSAMVTQWSAIRSTEQPFNTGCILKSPFKLKQVNGNLPLVNASSLPAITGRWGSRMGRPEH
jgi:ATP-dependent exoDNAse (exonuclease V) alpha subunit